MYLLDEIKQKIVKDVNRALGKKIVKASDLVYPPNREMGDLSLPCFGIAKELGGNPANIAADLLGKITGGDYISGLKTVGPYLNFNFKIKSLSEDLIGEIENKKDKYGKNENGKKKKVMIEYSNVNTHKEYHVGHLRNLCYGDSVVRILEANGYDSIPVSYINDFGSHVAKTIWAYMNFRQKEELPDNKGYFLGQTYVMATRKMKEDASSKPLVDFIMKRIEAREGREYAIWKETREWSIEQFSKIYEEMGVKFKNVFYENEFIDKGREMLGDLKKKGIIEDSQGAVIANLDKYGLGVLVVLRSDGTATYPVADIPLAIEKIKKYDLDQSIYVVDCRQSLYFKQLFKILELVGYKQKMLHLGYEMITLPEGAMSSRLGNVITYEDLRAKLIESATSETKKRHGDWSDEKINEVVKKIVRGAIKFEILKVGSMQVITFDIKKALDFSGYTSAYLQYTGARINSIIKKSGLENDKTPVDFNSLTETKEHEIVIKLLKYSEVVERACEKYDASEITKYLFELAQMFNDYYHSINISKAEEDVKKVRLALIKSVRQVLANGLSLLGIELIDEM